MMCLVCIAKYTHCVYDFQVSTNDRFSRQDNQQGHTLIMAHYEAEC